MSADHDPDDIADLAQDRAGVDNMQAQIEAQLKRSLALWAVRWVIGIGLAFAIVVFTGQYQWLPWAAVAVALVSLAVILIMHASLKRKFASTRATLDRAEDALRDSNDENT